MVSDLLKRIGEFLARVPGLPILVAIGLVALNFVLQLLPAWPVWGVGQKNVLRGGCGRKLDH